MKVKYSITMEIEVDSERDRALYGRALSSLVAEFVKSSKGVTIGKVEISRAITTVRYDTVKDLISVKCGSGLAVYRSLEWCKFNFDKAMKHNWDEVKEHPEQVFYV